MQYAPRLSSTVRTALAAGSLLATLAFGGVAASESHPGLTECDHGCMVAILSGQDVEMATYQVIEVRVIDVRAFIANGPGEIGFTR